MAEPILDPAYWKRRLEHAQRTHLHHAIFKCDVDRWRRIEKRHMDILDKWITPTASILDCGCGYGRLLSLLPIQWTGWYLGVDISPDFIALARSTYPGRNFLVGNLDTLTILGNEESKFDWAILISIRPMVKRDLGTEAWSKIEATIRRNSKHLLYLEYDENDNGSVE